MFEHRIILFEFLFYWTTFIFPFFPCCSNIKLLCFCFWRNSKRLIFLLHKTSEYFTRCKVEKSVLSYLISSIGADLHTIEVKECLWMFYCGMEECVVDAGQVSLVMLQFANWCSCVFSFIFSLFSLQSTAQYYAIFICQDHFIKTLQTFSYFVYLLFI